MAVAIAASVRRDWWNHARFISSVFERQRYPHIQSNGVSRAASILSFTGQGPKLISPTGVCTEMW